MFGRYLNPAYHSSRRITKSNKDFGKRLHFKDTNFLVKIRNIHKIEKKNSISISVFGYENIKKHQIYASKIFREEKHIDL